MYSDRYPVCFNPFIPEFLEWTLLSLNLAMSTGAKSGFSLKSKTEWQTVYIQMRLLIKSHLIVDLRCLHRFLLVCRVERVNLFTLRGLLYHNSLDRSISNSTICG